MNRFRARSPRIDGVRLVVLSLATAFAAGCGGGAGGDSTGPGAQSSDRLEILYSLDLGGRVDSLDLYLMDPDGSSSRSFVKLAGEESFPSWSPDGRTAVFQHRENGVLSLWRAGEDGSNAQRIPTNEAGLARWSPDGSWILFATPVAGVADVIAIHADGSGRRSLTSGISGVMLSPAAWSTTGRIAFMRASGTGGKGNLWAVNVDGSGLAQLTTGPIDQGPIWSPDGTLLAYTAWIPAAVPTGYMPQVVVVNANGSAPRVLSGADGSTSNILTAWSPDGQWLLYQHRGLENGVASCWFERVAVGGPSDPRGAKSERCGVRRRGLAEPSAELSALVGRVHRSPRQRHADCTCFQARARRRAGLRLSLCGDSPRGLAMDDRRVSDARAGT